MKLGKKSKVTPLDDNEVGSYWEEDTSREPTFSKWTLIFHPTKEEDIEEEFQDIQFTSSITAIRGALAMAIPSFVFGSMILIFLGDGNIEYAITLLLPAIVLYIILLGGTFLPSCSPTGLELSTLGVSIAFGLLFVAWNLFAFEGLQTTYVVGTVILFQAWCSDFFHLRFVCTFVMILIFSTVFVLISTFFDEGLERVFNMWVLLCASALTLLGNYNDEVVLRQKFLLERKQGNTIGQLRKETEFLKEELQKRELQKMEKQKIADFDSPMEKVLEKLSTLKKRGVVDFNDEELEDIQFICDTLANQKDIWSPDIASQVQEGNFHLDQETKSWLFSELVKEGTQAKQGTPKVSDPAERKLSRMRSSSQASLNIFPVVANNKQHTLTELLRQDKEWNFDIFALHQMTQGRALFFASKFVLKKHNLIEKFRFDQAKLQAFLEKIDTGYRAENPYHNNIHAADVVMNTHWLIVKGGLLEFLSELDVFIMLLAATIHDYDHPGLNNAFQIKTESDLAVRYNNKSVLENYHLAAAFALLAEDPYNFLCNLSKDERAHVRSVVIELVLATDMSSHFDILSHFKTKAAGGGFDKNNHEDKLLLMKMAIKIADLGNCTKNTFRQWTRRVTEEFWTQGDRERDLGIPISPFMDRAKPSIPKSQISFINFIVMPMVESYATFLKDTEFEVLKGLKENLEYWKEREEQDITLDQVWMEPEQEQEPTPEETISTKNQGSQEDSKGVMEEEKIDQRRSKKTKLQPLEKRDLTSSGNLSLDTKMQ